jgi:sortase A
MIPPRAVLLGILAALAGGEAAHRRPLLLWVERALWAIGIACLTVVLVVLAEARWFAWVQGRRLDQALAARAGGQAAGATPDAAAGPVAAGPSSARPAAPGNAPPGHAVPPAGQTDDLGAFQPSGAAAPPAAEGSLVGRIEISRLGLTSLVLEGVAASTLRLGVGHIPGTSLPAQAGNVGLAGHRDTVFRALKDVRPGDLILLDTLAGSYRYRVDWTRVVQPEDVAVLAASTLPELTLVTCYPFRYVGSAPERFIVRGHRVDGASAPDSGLPSASP